MCSQKHFYIFLCSPLCSPVSSASVSASASVSVCGRVSLPLCPFTVGEWYLSLLPACLAPRSNYTSISHFLFFISLPMLIIICQVVYCLHSVPVSYSALLCVIDHFYTCVCLSIIIITTVSLSCLRCRAQQRACECSARDHTTAVLQLCSGTGPVVLQLRNLLSYTSTLVSFSMVQPVVSSEFVAVPGIFPILVGHQLEEALLWRGRELVPGK